MVGDTVYRAAVLEHPWPSRLPGFSVILGRPGEAEMEPVGLYRRAGCRDGLLFQLLRHPLRDDGETPVIKRDHLGKYLRAQPPAVAGNHVHLELHRLLQAGTGSTPAGEPLPEHHPLACRSISRLNVVSALATIATVPSGCLQPPRPEPIWLIQRYSLARSGPRPSASRPSWPAIASRPKTQGPHCPADSAASGAGVGAGLLAALPADACGLAETARIAQSQLPFCMANGLARLPGQGRRPVKSFRPCSPRPVRSRDCFHCWGP